MGTQLAIEGTKQKHHPDISKAAEEYREVRDKRMELTEEETRTKGNLLALMKKHELDTYDDPDLEMRVTIEVSEETVKVKKLPANAAPSDGADGDGDEASEAPEAPASEPRKRSQPKGDGTKAHANGSSTDITSPSELLDIADEEGPSPRKRRKKKGKG